MKTNNNSNRQKPLAPARGNAAAICLLPAIALLACHNAHADSDRLPLDFSLHPTTFAAAGGGENRAERAGLRYAPVIMIPNMKRDLRDWTGHNPGNAPPTDPANVRQAFIDSGFQPIELWMLTPSPAGSIEENTDDLKFFITAAMGYTGADKVQLLAHGTGGILARLTLLKYRIAHWVESEVYIDAPFHGITGEQTNLTLYGNPNRWWQAPDSELLKELFMQGEKTRFKNPATAGYFNLRTLTVRNGLAHNNSLFAANPDSPCLAGAQNIRLPGLNHDALRASKTATDAYIPFLKRRARPYIQSEDIDQDGFRGIAFGGSDLDDNDPSVYPGAPEIRGDEIDQDCNGCDLALEGGRDGEIELESGLMRSAAARSEAPAQKLSLQLP